MKTDPTLGISGAAGMPLSHEAIQSGRSSAANTNTNPCKSEAISDTLETTDREGDGRQPWTATPNSAKPIRTSGSDGDQLDLTG